ncbi:MAG: alpha/beta hydrolase [Hungatella sp.]
MKTVFLHGLGQTASDWDNTLRQTTLIDADCPELFSLAEEKIVYRQMMIGLEKRYADLTEPFCICGLSLGATLALDYTIRHKDKVAALVLIAGQYKVPSLLIDFQNILFRCMPNHAFQEAGLSKSDMIKLAHSMRSLDFSKRLHEILCPVAIICGEKDTINMKTEKRLSVLLPQAELYLVPGAGHEVNKDAPHAIAAILDKFLLNKIPPVI